MAGLDTRGLADGFMKGFSFVDGYYDKEQQKERQAQLDEEQRQYRAQQQGNWEKSFGLQEQRAQTQDQQWQQSFDLQQQRFGADQQHQSWQRGRTEREDARAAAEAQRKRDLQDIQIELGRLAEGFEPTERGIELFSNPKYQQYNPLRIASPDMGEALSYAEQVIDPNSPADTNSPEGRKHLNYVLMPDLNTGRNGEGLKGGVRQFAALYPGQTEGTVAVEVEMEDGRMAPVTEKRGTADDGDDTILEEPVEKLVNQVQGYKTLRQALTTPQAQQGVAKLRQALGLSSEDAPELQTIYDADGNEMKVQWDRNSGRWVPVGGARKGGNFGKREEAQAKAIGKEMELLVEQGALDPKAPAEVRNRYQKLKAMQDRILGLSDTGATNNPLLAAIQSGQLKLNDPDAPSSEPAAEQGAQSAEPPAPFDPKTTLGLVNMPQEDWQERNRRYEEMKPAIKLIRQKLDAGWAPEPDELERLRPYLKESEVRLAEKRIQENKSLR